MASIFDVSVSSDSENDSDYIFPYKYGSSGSCLDIGNVSDCENSKKDEETVSALKRMPNLTENSKEISKIEIKKRADDVWNNFLSDVSETENVLKCASIVKSVHNTGTEIKSQRESNSKIFELNMDKNNNPLNSTMSAEENTTIVSSSKRFTGKRINIESVLQVVQSKKKKTSVLQKARHDWNTFKRSEGIEEDLKKFNKGKQGFIERQRFLERSDLRTFENEKFLRQSLKRA